MSGKLEGGDDRTFSRFLAKLVRVPKREIDKEEQKYQKEREELRQHRTKSEAQPRHSH